MTQREVDQFVLSAILVYLKDVEEGASKIGNAGLVASRVGEERLIKLMSVALVFAAEQLGKPDEQSLENFKLINQVIDDVLARINP